MDMEVKQKAEVEEVGMEQGGGLPSKREERAEGEPIMCDHCAMWGAKCQVSDWFVDVLNETVKTHSQNDLGNSSESRFPRKPGNSDFILFLKQPRNISESRFLRFFGNLETIPFLNDLGTLRKSGFLDFSDSSETRNPEHGN